MKHYFYHECPTCEFSTVTENYFKFCSWCLENSHCEVLMKSRSATDDDKPEGYDARTADPLFDAKLAEIGVGVKSPADQRKASMKGPDGSRAIAKPEDF